MCGFYIAEPLVKWDPMVRRIRMRFCRIFVFFWINSLCTQNRHRTQEKEWKKNDPNKRTNQEPILSDSIDERYMLRIMPSQRQRPQWWLHLWKIVNFLLFLFMYLLVSNLPNFIFRLHSFPALFFFIWLESQCSAFLHKYFRVCARNEKKEKNKLTVQWLRATALKAISYLFHICGSRATWLQTLIFRFSLRM